jgi:cytochrome c peroxidase
LKIFLAEPGTKEISAGRIGNCVACHTPPAFHRFRLPQHGRVAGGIRRRPRSRGVRSARDPGALPADRKPPAGEGAFRSAAAAGHPGRTDLGVWNVFANPAMPAPQPALRTVLGASSTPTDDDLARTIAIFKTPTVRDPGQTGPYFHTGRKDKLDDVLRHYARFSELARAGRVRNGDSKLREISITPADEAALLAFLRSLNEDYTD